MFKNGRALEELPNSDIDEFLIELTSHDVIQIEVFADDDNSKHSLFFCKISAIIVCIGSAYFSMDYWKCAKAQVEYEKIVYLYDSDEIILGSGDFHKIYDEEPNLKIEFVVYEQLQFEFKKLSIEQNSNTYKIFGNRGSNMHVKFIKFQANPMKKTKKIAEDSVMIQSKQSIDDSSPFIDNSVQLLSEASEDQVVEPENNLFGDQSSIVVSRATPKSRASPKITKNLNELQNEEEIMNNLDKLAKEFVDTTLAHTQDTEDILESKF